MTRLIQSSLIAVIILLAIAFGFYYFINKGAGIEAVMKAVPSDAACVLKMKLDAETAEEISKNVLLTKFRYVPAIEKFNALLQRIKDESAAGSAFQIFANNDLFLSVHATKTNNFDVLYLMPTTQVTSEEMKTLAESVWGKISNIQKRNYDGIDINQFTINNSEFCFANMEKVMVASFTPYLIEDAIRQVNVGANNDVSNLFLASVTEKDANNSSPVKLFLHHTNFNKFLNLFSNSTINNIAASCFSNFNISIDENVIDLTGKTSFKDNANFLSTFIGQQPVALDVLEYLPANTAMFTTYGFSNKELLKSQLKGFHASNNDYKEAIKTCSTSEIKAKAAVSKTIDEFIGNELTLVVTEPSGADLANSSYAFVTNENARSRIFRAVALAKSIKSDDAYNENYKNRQIVKLPDGPFLQVLFGNQFDGITGNYLAAIGQCIVFANSASALKIIIDKNESKQLFKNNSNFNLIKSKINIQSNQIQYYNADMMDNYLVASINQEWINAYQNYRIPVSNIGHVVINYAAGEKDMTTECVIISSPKIVRTLDLFWTCELPSTMLGEPHKVWCDNDTVNYIVAQDTSQQILVLNKNGRIVNAIPFNGQIQSRVYAVDKGDNDEYYLTFTTDTTWYMMKVDGTPADGFPRRLPSRVSASFSIFDFDENKNYSVFIPCNNGSVYKYNVQGIPNSDWNYQTTSTDKFIEPFQVVSCIDKMLLGGITATSELILINRESGICEITPQPLYSKKDLSVLNIDKTKCQFAFLDTTGVVKMLDKEYKITDAQLIGMPYLNVLFDDITGEGINHFLTLDSKNIAAYTQDNTELFQYPLPREGAEKLMLMNTENNEKFILYTSTGNSSVSLISADAKWIKGSNLKTLSIPFITDMNNDANSEVVLKTGEKTISVYTIK